MFKVGGSGEGESEGGGGGLGTIKSMTDCGRAAYTIDYTVYGMTVLHLAVGRCVWCCVPSPPCMWCIVFMVVP